MKKIAILSLMLCLVLSLAACSTAAATPVATTTEPTTSEAPTSEAAPTEPTCDHRWVDANYDDPKTCVICGETEGDKLTPVFEEMGYACDMVVGTAYEYKTTGHTDPTAPVTGTVTVTDYTIISSDDTHEALEGYEWRIARVVFEYTDAEFGVRSRYIPANYYNGTLTLGNVHTVSHGGEFWACEFREDVLRKEANGNNFVHELELCERVPVGFDGAVFVFYNAAYGSEEAGELALVTNKLEDIVDEGALFFRMA